MVVQIAGITVLAVIVAVGVAVAVRVARKAKEDILRGLKEKIARTQDPGTKEAIEEATERRAGRDARRMLICLLAITAAVCVLIIVAATRFGVLEN